MVPFIAQVILFACLVGATLLACKNMLAKMHRENVEAKAQKEAFAKRKAMLSGKPTMSWAERKVQKVRYSMEVIKMPPQTFLILEGACAIVGFFSGKIILTSTSLSLCMILLFMLLPVVFVLVRSNWYKQHEMAILENCMVTITSSYRSNKDIIKAVRENVEKTNMPVAFKNFLSEVTFVDSNVERALRKVSASFDNKYFDEWIEVLIKSQHDSHMMDILPVIIDEMDEAKKAQNESSVAMKAVWREYALWVVTCICVPLVLRLNNVWYSSLVDSPVGKGLVVALLVSIGFTLFEMIKISKPID